MPKSWEFIGGALCLDFINTVHCYGASDPGDDLTTADDLLSWAMAAKVLTPQGVSGMKRRFHSHPAAGRDALGRMKQIRTQLREIFTSSARRPRQEHVRDLNSLLRQQTAVPGIVDEDGNLQLQWHPHSLPTQGIILPILLSAAQIITGGDFARVRECASPTCTFLFLDTSKNHSRRWCDMRMCGNRAKVNQFRERQRRSRSG
ncbi:MAG: CGNR zinc finger domain-containing protein [Acidobacteriia bacterium]|nr:CGNR zinc finger domain-containing protein [Terriglobia bacterium]